MTIAVIRPSNEKTIPDTANVLIVFPHGLGDTAMLSVVLKHLQRYRKGWTVDVLVGKGKETALYGLCHRVFHDQEPGPNQDDYSNIVYPGFWESPSKVFPATKAAECLRHDFDIEFDMSLARYHYARLHYATDKATAYFTSIGAKRTGRKFNVALLHYSGNTSQHLKDLANWQAKGLCETIIKAGRIPVILDWDNRSPLPDDSTIFCPGVGEGDPWGNFGSGDAGVIAAMIDLAELFVGVDSGPGKIASSTDTPSLIIWTGHHPAHFHDPAPFTEHLIPADHAKMPPIANDPDMLELFTEHYQFKTYDGSPHGLLNEANRWLCGRLGIEYIAPPLRYVLPTGIGDTVWALHKINAINDRDNAGRLIDVILSGNPRSEVDRRSIPFLKRFDFINSVEVMDVAVLETPDNPTDQDGRYKYRNGMIGNHYYLCPNHALERGINLADWLPDVSCDWSIMDRFSWANTERGHLAGKHLATVGNGFVAFYLGPLTGNTDEGHNRGPIWTPQDWLTLGRFFLSKKIRPIVVGAEYDRSYWLKYLKHLCIDDNQDWGDTIGMFEIGETFAFLKHARCLISYQCGLAICLSYLGGRVVSFWRPDGDSIHPFRMVSFDERMADCWTNPKYRQNYLGCIYGREKPGYILEMIEERGWV